MPSSAAEFQGTQPRFLVTLFLGMTIQPIITDCTDHYFSVFLFQPLRH